MTKNRPDWIKRIAHNFTDKELDEIEKSAIIDANNCILINNLLINPGMLGAPIIISDKIKQEINNSLNQ